MTDLNTLFKFSDLFVDCVTFVDVAAPGRPCVFVSRKFEVVTGFEKSEVVGKNLSLLQGELTDPETIKFMRHCFDLRVSCVQDIVNYRKNGTPFLNRLLMLPMHSYSDENSFIYIGLQNDMTATKGISPSNEYLSRVSNDEIKHVMNNKLAIALSNISLMVKKSKNSEQVMKSVERFEAIVHSINDYILNIENLSEFEDFAC
jgi:hypothetical protein